MIRRLALGAAALAWLAAFSSHAGERPKAVIELFTSQGCSSCPAADELLARLAREPGIVALSLSVDYWDYLGWKDTLANPAFSERQRAYAAARGDRKIYTPQAVANGLTHAVGSDRDAIFKAVAAAAPGVRSLVTDARILLSGGGVVIAIDAGEAPEGGADVLLAWIDPTVPVTISRGENRGREIAYCNVVRRMAAVGRWTGEALQLDVPDVRPAPGQKLVVLVQAQSHGLPGPILAAAMSDF